jgi:hypothetical protein
MINIKNNPSALVVDLVEWTTEARVSQTVRKTIADLSTICQKEIQKLEELGAELNRSVDPANSSVTVLSQTLEMACQRLQACPEAFEAQSTGASLFPRVLMENVQIDPGLQVSALVGVR